MNGPQKELPPAQNVNDRFGVIPEYRIFGIGTTTAVFGIFDGFYRGFNDAALVYLAENSHRLPKTVGGWYFYHKRKNYVCIKNGLVQGAKFSCKLSSVVVGYFTVEALLDEYRGKVDFFNTVITTTAAAGVYARIKHFNRFLTRQIVKKASVIGLVSGLAQDLYIYSNGGKVWYLENMGLTLPGGKYSEKKLI